MSKLIIVESPKKIKSLENYINQIKKEDPSLEDEYFFGASVGHVVKMTLGGTERLGIDMENWEPIYKPDPGKKKVITELKSLSKKVDTVYIATDLDREGEAIAGNLVDILKLDNKYKRIVFNEITKDAFHKALLNPHEIDENLVKAQKTRRMLDRIIGFKLSGLMKRKITGFPSNPSAGRVQSVALKLVVDKEREREKFVPTQYFVLDLELDNGLKISWKRKEPITTLKETWSDKVTKSWIQPSEIEEIVSNIETETATIIDKTTSIRSSRKTTPFKQAALYRSADSIGISSGRVQMAAQKLYEGFGQGGLISYPRTDSTRLSNQFISKVKSFIKNNYGDEYVNEDIKGIGGAQDAHEAIRPTDITLTPAMANAKYNLEGAESSVYRLIYNNTLKAIMSPPKSKIISYSFDVKDNLFSASASKIIFDGYYKAIGFPKENDENIKNLETEYEKDDQFKIANVQSEEKFTSPPPRYSEGNLIATLDEIGVGRPSTFATTIKKIKERLYVEKEDSRLKPTEFGEIVLKKLVTSFKEIINEKYTAGIELKLDEISEGKFDYKLVMRNFYNKFDETLNVAYETLEHTKITPKEVGENCPECQSPLVYRYNKRNGDRFIGCSNFPNCKFMKPDPEFKSKRITFKKWTKKTTKKDTKKTTKK
ncbi:MAG: type I DNA topoisomerase [Mycoplasma sp.]|nr:type I DNA topoisomerase [Mycoplasma sp.]